MVTRRMFLRLGAAGLAAAGAGKLLGGCSRDDDEITIGAKYFQEQWILAALIARLAEREADLSAETKRFQTTFECDNALTEDVIQSYVEYTGTAYAAVLGHHPITDPDTVFEQVKREYAETKGIVWLPPLGFENKYAIFVRRETAEAHSLEKISDLAGVEDQLQAGFPFEFYDRADGYEGLVREYELSLGEPVPFGSQSDLDLGDMYRALDEGDVDLIVGHTTDGFISLHDIVMLEDDRRYFPPYYAAPLVRADTAEDHPAFKRVLESLGGRIDVDQMRRANHAVDSGEKSPEEAASALLSDLGMA